MELVNKKMKSRLNKTVIDTNKSSDRSMEVEGLN